MDTISLTDTTWSYISFVMIQYPTHRCSTQVRNNKKGTPFFPSELVFKMS